MGLSKSQLQAFRETLLTMRQETEQLIASSEDFGTKEELIKESMGELSSYDNHPGDHGTELYEREKDIALSDHTNRELKEINRALEKINSGSYGTCETCGKTIPLARLKAHPTATRCVEHSRDQTVAEQRPIEEEIIEPPFEKFVNDEGENTSYDAEDAWQDVAKMGTSETPSDFFSNEKTDYNKMYMNADERIGSVESVEGFLATNQRGTRRDVLENEEHEKYEEENENN